MESGTFVQNKNDGLGVQNNNNAAGTQNNSFVNYFNTAATKHELKNDLAYVAIAHKTLWDAVAGAGASHTAEQQFERGECLKGTREEVLRNIWECKLAGEQGSPISWLAGTVGVGETVIAMTVARACEHERLLVSSFFFFRSDPKRNVPDALILSIVHGLVSTISKDLRVLEARMGDQLRELILKPTLEWSWQRCIRAFLLRGVCLLLSGVAPLDIMRVFMAIVSFIVPMPIPNIVIIDGSDECSDDRTQLRILDMIRDAVHRTPHFPLRFLICSRPEAWIQEAFATEPFRQLSNVIWLDDTYRPAEDFDRFYRYHFGRIANSRQYNQVPFQRPWPSEQVLETLVRRSGGQFFYAKTAIKFIELSCTHPITQLQEILDNTANRPGGSPYPALDALYHVILSANPNHDNVLLILAAIIILFPYLTPSPRHIELLLGLLPGHLALTMRGMHSVLDICGPDDDIRVYHTSLRLSGRPGKGG
ncbi:hypothetical protein PQX77_000324 [Marasmius sp. AFHP31]|nr:hypothetical protein PQX77_000324 [Marasmius sp. AFHP31]